MADIELVIKIPEAIKHKVSTYGLFLCPSDKKQLVHAIVNGTPLPKNHGELKDFQKIYADMLEIEELSRQRVIDDSVVNSPSYMRYVTQLSERTAFKKMILDAPTVIEADTESEE